MVDSSSNAYAVARGSYIVDMAVAHYVTDWNKVTQHRCQPSRIRRDSPAFSSDVPRSREISRCPAFFENGIIIIFVADDSTVCLATQQSDEFRIKICKDRFKIRTPTGQLIINTLYYRSVRQMPSILHARQPSPTTVYFFNAATPTSSVNTATVVFTAILEYNTTHKTCIIYASFITI